jgi:hypothetical protein
MIRRVLLILVPIAFASVMAGSVSAATDSAGPPADATSTTVSCSPSTLTIGVVESTHCTASVTDIAASGTPPTGPVSFSAVDGILGGFCHLNAVSASESTCQTYYNLVPEDSLGTHSFDASYEGDSSHEPSQGSTTITVVKASAPAPGEEASAPSSAGAPATRLMKKPPKDTTKRWAKFAFSADQPGSSFECKLDRQPFKRCRSPFKKSVKPGAHTFHVRAVDSEGGHDLTPAVFHWKVMAD